MNVVGVWVAGGLVDGILEGRAGVGVIPRVPQLVDSIPINKIHRHLTINDRYLDSICGDYTCIYQKSIPLLQSL